MKTKKKKKKKKPIDLLINESYLCIKFINYGKQLNRRSRRENEN